MLTSIASAKPTEILRPTLGCFKHTSSNEHASNQQGMGYSTDAKDKDATHPHTKYDAPHPRQHLHYQMPCIVVRYVAQWIVPTVHD